jgi:hypothetical protein
MKKKENLCNSYEGKCVRPKREAEAVRTEGRTGEDPCWGVGISGELRGGKGVDYTGD